ncbi:MAG: isoaspartyl peptidase/L-asparaginase [Thermoanaerobaculia bacterium]
MYTSKSRCAKLVVSALVLAAVVDGIAGPVLAANPAPATALVVHGGAGTIIEGQMTPELEEQFRAKLKEALLAGQAILQAGGTSLDSVVAVIKILEDSPLFNAGKGAVFTADGRNEMDAAIMDGATGKAGAVAFVTRVKNPITAARAVMDHTEHVMLAGAGADSFAVAQGLELAEPEYFYTDRRWDQLQKAREEENAAKTGNMSQDTPRPYLGTVRALALDQQGRLAAATSTGGMTNKRLGRIGDTPIIGAGTWADPECAVSATGHGEFFIRFAVASDICARARYLEISVEAAAETVIHEVLPAAGGTGGVITLDDQGQISMPFNTAGMYRGFVHSDGEPTVRIYK